MAIIRQTIKLFKAEEHFEMPAGLHEQLAGMLRDIEELSTAETLGITLAAVKVRLLRARLMLRERLTRLFGDETTRIAPHSHAG
jgi:DNA-directed RNA polymerase specialized sigma24 family protein